MYKNILIPVLLDGTRDQEAPLEVAQTLADKDAEFTLLHVFETIPVYATEYIPPDFLTATRETMQAKLAALAKTLPNCHGFITDGRAGARISEWAEKKGNDCIVIASHTPALSDILLGSVAAHVVRHAKCAVHVTR